jgi:hypothetical protein
MGIRVLEIHHHAVRIDSDPPKVEAVRKFYADVRRQLTIYLKSSITCIGYIALASTLLAVFHKYPILPFRAGSESPLRPGFFAAPPIVSEA